MVADGQDTFTVMAVSGDSSTRMLERYTHPGMPPKARGPYRAGRLWARNGHNGNPRAGKKLVDGRRDRTPGLRIANAALSQLS